MSKSPATALLDRVHGQYVHNRRIRILSERIDVLLPHGARVLDVGCGDGLLDKLILQRRPDLEITGCDVLVRPDTHIRVLGFDGATLPADDRSYDVVLFVDVLHHTNDPRRLLVEAARVARDRLVIKDHTADGLLAYPTLRFMDWVGNARHGVRLTYNYLARHQWDELMDEIGLRPIAHQRKLGLYPWYADWWFGRGLHFVGTFAVPNPT